MKQLILTIALLLISSSSTAGPKVHGNKACGIYIEQYDARGVNKAINTMWLKGYLTGRNYADDGQRGKDFDDDSMSLWVYNYCKENPLENTSAAAKGLAAKLEKSGQ